MDKYFVDSVPGGLGVFFNDLVGTTMVFTGSREECDAKCKQLNDAARTLRARRARKEREQAGRYDGYAAYAKRTY